MICHWITRRLLREMKRRCLCIGVLRPLQAVLAGEVARELRGSGVAQLVGLDGPVAKAKPSDLWQVAQVAHHVRSTGELEPFP